MSLDGKSQSLRDLCVFSEAGGEITSADIVLILIKQNSFYMLKGETK